MPEPVIINKALVSSIDIYYAWSELKGWLNVGDKISATDQTFIDFGMELIDVDAITKSAWQELSNPSISYYTDDPNKTEVLIETEVEPFTIYDEMGSSMDVLYYTDDDAKLEADLYIKTKYSHLDTLNGNFEVVSWTDATSLELYMKNDALPQFVYKSSPETIYGYFDGLNFTDNGKSYYLISYDKIKWYAWDGTSFIVVDTVNMDNIIAQGMTSEMTKTMTSNDWNTWTYENLYIGVYLEDSLVETNKITSKLSLPLESPEINEAKLYVLNTKSTIEVKFAGSTIYGDIKDVDEGKVQYRIILNGANYFPENGEFTPLMASPLNIDTTIPNSKILIDENNTLRIEFQDYWGTTDYWEANFIGTYFGLLFSDATGDYYSTNIGEVLKYLDFGIIIAGQTTLKQEIILKNTYGYSVENVNIKVDKKVLPAGMKGQFGTSNTTFESLDELNFNEIMLDGDEKTFYFRISTELGVTPVSNGKFGIIVTADEVIAN